MCALVQHLKVFVKSYSACLRLAQHQHVLICTTVEEFHPNMLDGYVRRALGSTCRSQPEPNTNMLHCDSGPCCTFSEYNRATITIPSAIGTGFLLVLIVVSLVLYYSRVIKASRTSISDLPELPICGIQYCL